MSNSFSFSRLGKLIAKQFFENARFYLFGFLALLGLLSIVFTFYIAVSEPNHAEEEMWIIGMVGLMISGSIFASLSFNMLGSRDKGTYWLGIPATHLEKLVCTIFYTTIVFFAVYCVSYFTIRGIAISLLREAMENNPARTFREVDPGSEFFQAVRYFICAFFAVQSLYLLGSVYFKRYAFIVTTVVTCFLYFAFWVVHDRVADALFDKFIDWEFLEAHVTKDENTYQLYSASPGLYNVIVYLFQFAWAPIFWVATWYRLKEKEI